jgi:hypothetical protein
VLSVSLEIARRKIPLPSVCDVSFKNQCYGFFFRLLACIDRFVATPWLHRRMPKSLVRRKPLSKAEKLKLSPDE